MPFKKGNYQLRVDNGEWKFMETKLSYIFTKLTFSALR